MKFQAELDAVPLPVLSGVEEFIFTPYSEWSLSDVVMTEGGEVPDQFGSMLGSSEVVLERISEDGETVKVGESSTKPST